MAETTGKSKYTSAVGGTGSILTDDNDKASKVAVLSTEGASTGKSKYTSAVGGTGVVINKDCKE